MHRTSAEGHPNGVTISLHYAHSPQSMSASTQALCFKQKLCTAEAPGVMLVASWLGANLNRLSLPGHRT
jgi:hypothetical protein